MANNQLLVDSSFLFAVNNVGDANYHRSKIFADKDKRQRLIPEVVLTEVTYMLRVSIGQNAVLRFLDVVMESGTSLQSLTPTDLARARQIMATYADARLDFVDCAIMALSERLNIRHICTFDRRDFSIFRPTHCDYLDLLP
jgi:predicted nucleic acid-binding protein